MCTVYPLSLTVDLIDCKQNPTATTKKKKKLQTLLGLRKLRQDLGYSVHGRSPFIQCQMQLSVPSMVRRRAIRKVFSHPTRDLECFLESSNTPWNPSTIFRPSQNATVQQRFLFVSERRGVEGQGCQDKSSQAFPNFRELSM